MLTLAGVTTLYDDSWSFVSDVASAAQENPLGIILLLLGLAVGVLAFWDEILAFLDIQGTRRIGDQIKDLLHLKHGWALQSSDISNEGFRIVAEYNSRVVTFLKDKNDQELTIGTGIVPDDTVKVVFDHAETDEKNALREDLSLNVSFASDVEIKADYGEAGELTRIALATRLDLRGGLDEFRLLDRIGSVIRACFVVETSTRRWARRHESSEAKG